jgi:hypothetical protein
MEITKDQLEQLKKIKEQVIEAYNLKTSPNFITVRNLDELSKQLEK